VSEGVKTVTEIRVITNQSQLQEKYHRFVIEADDYLSTEKYARSQGLSIVGVYHSHPDHPCEPSEYDREHALPFYSYLIVSIENRQENGYASWVLKNNRSAFDLEEPNII
jgi:proteasome lid subunit RPN8/RPN11